MCRTLFLLGSKSCWCEKVVGEVPSLSNSYKSFINKSSPYRSSRKHVLPQKEQKVGNVRKRSHSHKRTPKRFRGILPVKIQTEYQCPEQSCMYRIRWYNVVKYISLAWCKTHSCGVVLQIYVNFLPFGCFFLRFE